MWWVPNPPDKADDGVPTAGYTRPYATPVDAKKQQKTHILG
jgi:hypothetical protein